MTESSLMRSFFDLDVVAFVPRIIGFWLVMSGFVRRGSHDKGRFVFYSLQKQDFCA